jgi:hypothetical protein
MDPVFIKMQRGGVSIAHCSNSLHSLTDVADQFVSRFVDGRLIHQFVVNQHILQSSDPGLIHHLVY